VSKKCKGIIETIEAWLKKFPEITKEESDLIAQVCVWTDEERLAFLWAKNIFEGKDEEEEEDNYTK
jgi:hypothetical protein